ncbi:hypothetical protein [uncultured Gordonia sp.]|uniref:hypothetical protein n=1 Tax=uncultured Gordonia sp. TaxID=198437 RepID=UPI002596966C|nr:hypothetical protein [uncultured Gordonia sp.]
MDEHPADDSTPCRWSSADIAAAQAAGALVGLPGRGKTDAELAADNKGTLIVGTTKPRFVLATEQYRPTHRMDP